MALITRNRASTMLQNGGGMVGCKSYWLLSAYMLGMLVGL
jgi:hypothetical protein